MIKPLIAWFRGEPAKDKVVKAKGEDKTSDGSNPSDTAADEKSVR